MQAVQPACSVAEQPPGGDPHRPGPPTARRPSPPPVPAPRSSRPAPRPPQVPARPERAPPWQQLGPPAPREEHGGRHSARTSGEEGALPGAARTPISQRQNGLVGPTGPAPPPSSPGTSVRLPGRDSPLFRLPGLAFPGEKERVRGGRSPSGASTRRRRSAPGRGAGPERPLRPGGCARRERRAGGGRGGAGRRGGPAQSARTRPSVRFQGRRPGSQRTARWLGLDCCTFFFVRCILRNKKKSPTLHATSFASLKTRSPATAACGAEDCCGPRTPQPAWWDGHSCWDQSQGSGQGSSRSTTKVK